MAAATVEFKLSEANPAGSTLQPLCLSSSSLESLDIGSIVLTQASTQGTTFRLAIVQDNILTVLTRHVGGDEDEQEETLEFENACDALAWDPEGLAVIVGDASGTLHFTNARSGDLVFSHRIVPRGSSDTFGSEEPRILSISFVGPAPVPALIVLFDNGDVFGISKLPVSTICGLAQSQPQVLAAAVQRLQFLRLSLELNGHDDAITKASACSCGAKGASWASVLTLGAGQLLVTELNTALPSSEASAEASCWQLAEGTMIVDFVVVASVGLCVSLGDDGSLALWDLGARAKLASCPASSSSSSPPARPALSLVHHHREEAMGSNAAAGAEDIVFVSVGSNLFALRRGGLGVALGPVPDEASEGLQLTRPATDSLSGLFIHAAEADADTSGCELSFFYAPALLERFSDFARGVQLAACGTEIGALLDSDGTSLADASTCTLAGYLAALASDLCSALRVDAGLHRGLLSLTILPAVKAAMQSRPTLLPLILAAVRGPPVGFVSTVLGSLQGDGALLEDWRRRLATAKDLVALASGGGEADSARNTDDDSDRKSDDDEEEGETEVMPDPQAKALKQEELLRRAYLSLRPSLLASTYAALVSRGLLEQAARVLSAHAWSPASAPFAPAQLLKSVPGSMALGRLQEWVSTHLVPTARRLLQGQEGAEGTIALALYGVAGELASRALAFERSSSEEEEDEDGAHVPSPLPLAAMTTASRLLHSVGVAPPQGWPDMPADVSRKALQRVGSALLQLQTQAQAWERLGVAYSLAEVQQLGLQGIAAERLWVVPEAELLSSMPTLQALLRDFRGDLDAVLSEWIRDATMRRVIVDRDVLNRAALEEAQSSGGLEAVLALLASTAPLDVEHSEGSLSRLILGASAIASPALRAEAVLLLLQTPAITGSGRDEEESLGPESDEDDDASSDSTTSSGGRGRGKGRRPLLVNSACSAALNLMASALLEPSPSTSFSTTATASSAAAPQSLALPLRESLAAALRAQKIRTLAHKYGVVPGGFDPRSQQQVRALVRLVSSRVDIPDSLADCLYIAEIWGSTGRGGSAGLDVSSVLTRAIVARASDASVAEGDVESVVVGALAAVPAANLPLVAEDALACLLGNLDDVLRRAVDGPASNFRLSDPCDKDWARRLCRGALVVASAFLDKRGGKAEARAPSGSNSGPFSASSAGPVYPERVSLLKRMRLLQQLDIFVSEATLRSARACQETARALAARRAEELLAAGEMGSLAPAPTPRELALSAVTPSLRRACNLLGASSILFLHGLFKALLSGPSMTPRVAALAAQVARCMQVEGSSACSTGPRAAAEESSLILDTALHLCGLVGRKGAMAVSSDHASASASASPHSSSSTTAAHVEPFFVARELLALAAVHGSGESVSRVVDLVSGTELALAVLLRTEGGSDATSGDESAFRVSAAVFERDGLIMPAAAVVPPLLKFSLREQLRRSLPPSSSSSSSSDDVEELVQTLQKYESHLLASRVLCHSWALGATKTALLRTSLTALSRRILSYREIDCDLAVATLLSLPFDTMVSELKASVPTIQSDFSRLLTVAVVGEELARLWDHTQLLQVFQGLQINARWWGLLTGYGIAIEPSLFQSENARARDRCIRDLVPLLLDANHLDLDEAVEYCRQFDLEPEFAVLCYVERLLLQEPTFPSDPHWPRCIRAASQRAPEEVLLRLFRRVLGSIDGRDYEKIIFLASWLVSSDEDELEGPRSTNARADEVALYRHYIDVCSFLTSLPVPPEAAAAASSVTTVQALSSSSSSAVSAGAVGVASAAGVKGSKGVVGSGVYGSRLSAWALISDPWAVLTPIFLIAPGVSVKLTPLVSHLGLDESEYSSKLLLASYADAAPGSGSARGRASRGAEAHATVSTQLQEQMLSIPCPITRVQTWQQLAALERGRGDAPLAAALLLQGLQQARLTLSQAAAAAAASTEGKGSKKAAGPAQGHNPTLLVSKSLLLDAHDVEALAQLTRRLLAELTSALLTLHGEQACEELRLLVSSSLWGASKGGSRLLAGAAVDQSWAAVVARVGRAEEALCLPRMLLPRLLEVGAAVCWDLHLAALSEGQGVCCPSLNSLGSSGFAGSSLGEGLVPPTGPSIFDVLRAPLPPTASDLVSGLRRLTLALAKRWRELDAPPDQAQGDSFTEMRHALVGKLLSDVDAGGVGVGSGGSSSSGLGVGGQGQGSAAAAAAWASPSATPLLQPTAAERRRREDAYRAMCVTVFAACSWQGEGEEGGGAELSAHEEQLEAVALGKGPRSMRRLSARSRLRASQALLWLPTLPLAQAQAKTQDKGGARGLRDFLLCLAELQETRLACDEETLRSALLPSPPASQEDNDEEREEAEAARAQHAQALVHTWLHDEGAAEAVVELARDVLLLSSSSAGGSGCGPAGAARAAQAHLAWRALIQHAEQRRFSRVLLQTLHLLRGGHSGWGVSLALPALSPTAPAPLLAAPAIHAAAVALLTKLSAEVVPSSSAPVSRTSGAAVTTSGPALAKALCPLDEEDKENASGFNFMSDGHWGDSASSSKFAALSSSSGPAATAAAAAAAGSGVLLTPRASVVACPGAGMRTEREAEALLGALQGLELCGRVRQARALFPLSSSASSVAAKQAEGEVAAAEAGFLALLRAEGAV